MLKKIAKKLFTKIRKATAVKSPVEIPAVSDEEYGISKPGEGGPNGKYYCPCCSCSFQKFKSFPYWERTHRYNPKHFENAENFAICPACGSSPRHRILVSWMQEHKEELEGKRILHFAQEPWIRSWLDEHGMESTSADLYLEADLKIDIQDTGLPDDSVPVIICNHVLEHVDDYKKALTELRRILRGDGTLILSVPIDMTLDDLYEDKSITSEEGRWKAFGQIDHVRVFGRNTVDKFEALGFDVEVVEGDTMPPEIKPVVGPADYDANWFYLMRKKERGTKYEIRRDIEKSGNTCILRKGR